MNIITNQMVVDSIESTIKMLKINLSFYETEINKVENTFNKRYYDSLNESILKYSKDLKYWETELASWISKLK